MAKASQPREQPFVVEWVTICQMENERGVLNGRYRLLQRAGVGGMATVYKGQDLMLGRLVAVKVLHESLTGDADFLRRFQQEAHAAANLAHPNIVTVHDIGQDGRRYYIVMEYVEGSTLKEVVRRHIQNTGRPISVARALELAVQICAGVGYAHRANLVHCDVKPQNILVTSDSRVKVADFGIARAFSEASRHDESLVFGTPQYFSPEQAAGEAPTPASDVYSIGIILFEMLSGRLPFKADTHTDLAAKHLREMPPPVTAFNAAVPIQIQRIITKVLSKEPAGRYRTADQLGRILESYRENGSEETSLFVDPVPRAANITEKTTAFYRRATTERQRPRPQRAEVNDGPSYLHIDVPPQEPRTDWTAIVLGIVALASLLGLIPLWYLVYLRYVG